MGKFLVLVDVDQLQSYVFSTHRLREIRSASCIVSQAEELMRKEVEREFPHADVLVATAGVLKVVVEGEEAAVWEAAEGVARKVSDLTGIATATHHVQEWRDDEKFGEVLQDAEAGIRARKDQREWFPFFPSHPLFRLCELCGQMPAVEEDEWLRIPGEPRRKLCRVCAKKSEVAKQWSRADEDTADEGKKAIKKTALWVVKESVCGQVRKQLPENRRKNGVVLPGDFGGLVARREGHEEAAAETARDEASERGFMGLLYADGNRMGEFWREFAKAGGTAEQYREISKHVGDATRDALVEAVVGVFAKNREEELKRQGDRKKLVLPFLPLMLGGDDVVCVTSGAWALPLAKKFVKEFALRMASCTALQDGVLADLPHPNMSVGVTIIKSTFPIQQAFSHAKDLLKNAKAWDRERRADFEGDPGTIDFAVVMDTTIRSVREQREKHFSVGSELELTERPYPIREDTGEQWLTIGKLLEAVGILRQAEKDEQAAVPRSKLKRLPVLLRDVAAREHDYAEWEAGLRDKQRETWKEVCGGLELGDGKDWKRQMQVEQVEDGRSETRTFNRTAILDMLELLDIMTRG